MKNLLDIQMPVSVFLMSCENNGSGYHNSRNTKLAIGQGLENIFQQPTKTNLAMFWLELLKAVSFGFINLSCGHFEVSDHLDMMSTTKMETPVTITCPT
jgi:hypothetical protein